MTCIFSIKTMLLIIKAIFIILPVKCCSVVVPPESLQLSASAPMHIMSGCLAKRVITLDPTSWSIKEVVARQTRQSDYIALTLSLSHRSLTVGLLYSPWYVRVYPNTVRLHT